MPAGLPTGLDEIRESIGQPWVAPMCENLGMVVIGAEPGLVELTAPTSAAFTNAAGMMHGGWAAALLDTACSMAAHAGNPAGHYCVTIELKVAYYRPIPPDVGVLTVVGRRIHGGRTMVFTEGAVRGPDGKDYAGATATMAVRPRP